MTAALKTWTDGEAITTTEQQRSANAAAYADDRALEPVFTPYTQKSVLPLVVESGTVDPIFAFAYDSPGNGRLSLKAARFIAGGVGLPYHVNMAHHQETDVSTGQFAANSSGSDRFDLVYATVSQYVSATGSRKVKDIQSGAVTTQVLNLEKKTQVVLNILTGSLVLPSDPADGSAYNFAICSVKVPNGYTLGASFAATLGMSVQNILYDRSYIAPARVKRFFPLIPNEAARQPATFKAVARMGYRRGIEGSFRYSAAAQTLTLTAPFSVDNRVVTIRMARNSDNSALDNSNPGAVNGIGGVTLKVGSTATNNIAFDGKNFTFSFSGTTIFITCVTAPTSANDNWWFEMEFTDNLGYSAL
jgi:hypothetical protein